MAEKKLSLFLWLMLVFSVLIPNFTVSATTGISISINNDYIEFNDSSGFPFVDSANRTQVPLRITMESCNCEVSWDSSTQTAVVEKKDIIIKVPIGQPYIVVNGVIKPTDTVAVIKNNRTYLPIRPVLEALGAYVTWDQDLQMVGIYDSTIKYENIKNRYLGNPYRYEFYLTFAMIDLDNYLNNTAYKYGDIWETLMYRCDSNVDYVFISLLEDLDFYFETGNDECEIMWADIDDLFWQHCFTEESPVLRYWSIFAPMNDKVDDKLEKFFDKY